MTVAGVDVHHTFLDQRAQDQLGLFLCETVTVPQLSVIAWNRIGIGQNETGEFECAKSRLTIAPAVHVPVVGQGKSVTVAPLGRGNFNDARGNIDGFGRHVIVAVAQAQPAVAPFTAGANRAAAIDEKCTVLPSFGLETIPRV